ncbi:MAG: acyloxyacyl hydrolase [Verrucomicrobiia bacterium]|nr:acyloxyacyl hydrolase [Verrucomicrobiae bacterium]
MKKIYCLLVATLIFVCGKDFVFAGEDMKGTILEKDIAYRPRKAPRDTRWDQGNWEFSFVTGPFFGPATGGERDRISYYANSLRAAYNLTDILGSNDAWYRGNVQLVGELFIAEIFNTVGGGSIVVGPNVLARYNFVQPGWKIVPFVQAGPGLVYTDTDNNAIGSHYCFQLNGGAGLRYLINDDWAVSVEGDWHHMSNAGFAKSNLGADDLGGQVGVSYFLH